MAERISASLIEKMWPETAFRAARRSADCCTRRVESELLAEA